MIFLPLPFHKSSRSKWRHEVVSNLLWVSLLIMLGSDCEPSVLLTVPGYPTVFTGGQLQSTERVKSEDITGRKL